MGSWGLKEQIFNQIKINRMRKIKFRAWHISKQIMASVSGLNHCGDVHVSYKKGEPKSGYFFGGNRVCDDWNENEHVLMQSIGLQDKQENEIFEGDLLVDRYPVDEENLSLGYNESFLPVVWSEEQLMWCVDVSFKKNGSYLTSLVDYFGEYLEVKGNVYETPEYLPSGSIYGYTKNP